VSARLRVALPLAVVLLLGGTATAQTPPGVRAETLANGFTVLVRENPVAPVVAVSLLVRMGTRWETPANAGISNFTHAVMVKGTTRRRGAELAEKIAALGGKLNASGDVDYSEIRGTALARFWRDLLGITAELALEPALAPDEVDTERDWLQSRIQKRRDAPASRAFDEFFATLYGAHPYAKPVLGTKESLARIDAAAIVAHYRTFYRPERMTLAVSGQVSADEVVAEARRLFGAMERGGGAADPPVPPPVRAARRVVIDQPAQQAQILVGGLAPSLDHPDHAPVKVLATVLGGGLAGRLFVELRDKRGLAYTATAYYDPVREPGALVLYLGTAPENAAGAEQALLREVARIRDEAVSADELRRAKGYLLGKYTMDRRTNERQAWYLAFYRTQGVGDDYPVRYRRAVEAVTVPDLQRVARQYLGTVTTVVLRPPPAR
jgi:predicted Zn-dependent peptidase